MLRNVLKHQEKMRCRPRAASEALITGHEHLDNPELIHMNGRVYDYNLARFLSVDPFIQEPGNSQSLNPYSYILNNPLAGKDPSGYLYRNPTAPARPNSAHDSGVGVSTSTQTCHTVSECNVNAEKKLAQLLMAQYGMLNRGNGANNRQGDQAQGGVPDTGGLSDALLSELSACVYEESCSGSGGFERVGEDHLKELGLNEASFADEKTGFKSSLFYSEEADQYVLAFAGTDGLSWKDWKANIGQAFGFKTKQYEQAKVLADKVNNAITQTRSALIFTGHSLGGELASAAAIVTGRSAVTFNAAGLHQNTVKGFSIEQSSSQIRAYQTKADVVSLLQNLTPFPNAAGQRLVIDNYTVHMISGVCRGLGTVCDL